MVSCHGGYIHLEPLTTLRAAQTVAAMTRAVAFFRSRNVHLVRIRMDNQKSADLVQAAAELKLKLEYVTPFAHQPNRAERAIRTAKNHIIASRAGGFHPHSPTTYLDKCMEQIELTLNIIHPYEYDPRIFAFESDHGETHDFNAHPIAPVGAKVLTWDAPEHRGTWNDHDVEAVYLGPALDHLRAFEVWVPNTSAARITNTVWWFLKDLEPDTTLLLADTSIAYPLGPTHATMGQTSSGEILLNPN
jgi:hypothetical protein